MSAAKPVLLVDGSSYLHRAYNALPPLSTRAGEPTGAVYGVIAMLRKLLEDYRPDELIVVFDPPGKTARHALYPAYKAHRPPLPDELVRQIEPLYALIRALGLPLVQIPGVEADDVIATLAQQAAGNGQSVVIVSGDKDLAQLVDERITLLDTMRNTKMDAAGVERKFGVPPERIVDYLALVGDSSDNVPGVPGVGPKTATRWLQEYGSLDALIARADTLTGKVAAHLRAGLGQLALSRRLVTLDCAVPLDFAPAQLRRTEPDRAALRELFNRYEFKSWLAQLDEDSEAAPEPTAPVHERPDYQLILDTATLAAWLEQLQAADLFAFDTETTSLNYMEAQLVGVSFAVQPGAAAYVPLAHVYPGAPEQLDRDTVLAQLRPLLEDPQRPKVGQHLKYDWHVLTNHGIALAGMRHDTMLESYVLDSTATRHDLDSMAETYLNFRTIHYEDVAGKGAKQIGFEQVPVAMAGEYAAEDADVTLRLHEYLWPKLRAQPELQRVYEGIEIPLIPVLGRLERAGVQIDVEQLHRQSRELAVRMYELEQEAHALAGQPFNLGSPKQLQCILYDKLGLVPNRKTPTGQPSTAEDVLQELAYGERLPAVILEHRALSKLKSTYTDRLPEEINPHTGRVHTSYHQAVASTGRLSSSNPNLQQIPARTPEGRRIRQAFVPPPGYRILAADYSQIELRIMAHLSEDPGLLQAFAAGMDIHRATASELFGVPPEQVNNDQRRTAKTINFGLIYGMSAFGLARSLGIDREPAQEYVDRYFARYPGVRNFMDTLRRQAAADGFVETVYGRRLYLPEIRAHNPQRRQAAERTAINAPMQGTAADIIKRAMLAVDSWLQDRRPHARMIMQVHDELVFEVAEDAVEQARERIRALMVGTAELRVPLEVEVGAGGNWDEAH